MTHSSSVNLIAFFVGAVGAAIALDRHWATAGQLLIGGGAIFAIGVGVLLAMKLRRARRVESHE